MSDEIRNDEITEKKDPFDAAREIASGNIELITPIQDGEITYKELKYDFDLLTGLELARAIDSGSEGKRDAFNLSDTAALNLFAAAAAKATGGLDATDIVERMGARDAVTAIKLSAVFFSASSAEGSMKYTKKQSSSPA